MAASPLELLALASDVAREAGLLLTERLPQARTAIGTKSSVTDMVTEVDRESEALVVSRILAARPGDAILGEEGAAHAGTSGVRWLIDPLDGTTNYIYAYPAFAVSIAAEVDGEVVAGTVFDAARAQAFTAAKGSGAFLDGRAIRVSTLDDISRALVGTGFGYDSQRRLDQGATLARVLPQIRDIRRSGSAALDLCSVACGRLDAYFEYGLNPWDLAAGGIIVREAGGLTEGYGEGTFDGGWVVAAPPALMGPFQELLKDARGAG
jgi:myo-inositol-1(or 4)-monophosphatase